MGGGMGGGGIGMGGVRLAAPPTQELMELIDKLPPIRDEPSVDLEDEERPEPNFLFRRLLSRHKRELVVALFLVSLNALGMAAGPLIIRFGIDHGVIDKVEVESRDAAVLWYASLAFVGVVLLTRILAYVNAIFTGRIGQHLLLRLRVRVFAQLQRLGLDYYEREMVGRIMTRMTSDIEALQSLLQTGFIQAMVHAVTFIGVTVVLLTMNAQLAGVFMLILPPLVIATVYFRRSSSRAYTKVRDRIAAVNATFQESISGVRVTQAFVREGRNMSDFRDVAGLHRAARLEGTRLSSTFFPFVEMLSTVAMVIVFGFGSVLIGRGSLSEGELVAFALYITTVFAPIQQLSQVFDTYQQGRAAAEKLRELLATEVITPEAEQPVVPLRLRGEIAFEDVRFHYPGMPNEALSGVSLRIHAGETVALVGETGAGKSTIMKLVARFYDPTAGGVLVDGVDLRHLDLHAYRHQLGYVPQEAFLFTGTIRDNVAYGRPDATDEEVEEAARAVGAHDFIARLSYGYHTPVVERGRSLSSGQKQLIALARAQLVDPAILLLDEATANLDLATEARVQRAMGMVSAGRTTILIAHRLQTAAKADRIIAIDCGVVAEAGSHDELLAAGGRYAELWTAFTGDAATPART
jgi:ATP-binding cassette subfamily B protein